MPTIAIPRVADCHYYHILWKNFFENLGFEVILSPETTKAIVDAGVKAANTDLCFAMKVYYGHILELMKQKFDILFVPSTIGSHKKTGGDYCCAYFAALPSIVKSSFLVELEAGKVSLIEFSTLLILDICLDNWFMLYKD